MMVARSPRHVASWAFAAEAFAPIGKAASPMTRTARATGCGHMGTILSIGSPLSRSFGSCAPDKRDENVQIVSLWLASGARPTVSKHGIELPVDGGDRHNGRDRGAAAETPPER